MRIVKGFVICSVVRDGAHPKTDVFGKGEGPGVFYAPFFENGLEPFSNLRDAKILLAGPLDGIPNPRVETLRIRIADGRLEMLDLLKSPGLNRNLVVVIRQNGGYGFLGRRTSLDCPSAEPFLGAWLQHNQLRTFLSGEDTWKSWRRALEYDSEATIAYFSTQCATPERIK